MNLSKPDGRYDVEYTGNNQISLVPHFCREWEDGEGCYGYNKHYGFSFNEAKNLVIGYYENLQRDWQEKTEEDYCKEQEIDANSSGC